MSQILRLVLDVMKPHEPGIIEFATEISDLEGIDGVNSSIVEIDRAVENIKITVEGPNIKYEELKGVIEKLGGSVHSVDQVICGEDFVEEIKTPQD